MLNSKLVHIPQLLGFGLCSRPEIRRIQLDMVTLLMALFRKGGQHRGHPQSVSTTATIAKARQQSKVGRLELRRQRALVAYAAKRY